MGKEKDNVYLHDIKKKKKKRKRTTISAEDSDRLECMFKLEPLPTRQAKTKMAKEIRKSENFVNIWFQNRRARERRIARGSEGSVPNTDTPLLKSKTGPADKTNGVPTQLLGEIEGLFDHSVSLERSPMFGRIVRMAAAAENGILQKDSPFLSEAMTDACRGIAIADGRLIYHSTCGFAYEDGGSP